MKIAFFSPLNPKKSGISDYSEELLPVLSKYMDIDVFVDNFSPTNPDILGNYNIYDISEFGNLIKKNEYDEILYHMGNNTMYHEAIYETALRHPGIVVLHDYAIHHLIAKRTVGRNDWQAYIDEMYYNFGEEGKQFAIESSQGKRRVMWETGDTLRYPANLRLLNSSKGVIVHSKYIRDLIMSVKPDIPVQYVPLHASEAEFVSEADKDKLKQFYNIPKDCFIFASYGFVSSAKRIDIILRAMKRLSENHSKFIYLLVGEEEKGTYEMSKYIEELKLDKNARYIGFVELDEFKDYIKLSDVCINLRYPTQGETSASLIRILGMGKPAIVSNIGTFMEIPDEFCLKVNIGDSEEDEIYNHLTEFMNYPEKRLSMGKKAYEYIKNNHTLQGSAEKYYSFVKNVYTGKAIVGNIYSYYDSICNIADRLSEIGVNEENRELIEYVSNKIGSLF